MRVALALLCVSCATGGPGSEGSATVSSLGEGGTTDAATTDIEDSSDSGGSSSSGVASTSSGEASGTTIMATCDDMLPNGDESDVDCGGSCPACDVGQACVDPTDCMSAVCEGELCCIASTYERTTGEISGNGSVCCDGTDMRLEVTPCGTGRNYTVQEEAPNCASTSEGPNNNGTACVLITCQLLDCTATGSSG